MRIRIFYLLYIWVIVLGVGSHSAYANIYATDLRLNGGTNNALVLPGRPLSVSYILNEPASGGVILEILSGTNVVNTFCALPGAPGTSTGANTLSWDGLNSNSLFVSNGLYSVRITASSRGYDSWTQISDDLNCGISSRIPYPSIAVNQNSNSPYYGRVFIGAAIKVFGEVRPDGTGIFKFNSDCSPADEGGFATGGYLWQGANIWGPVWDSGITVSPWKLKVSQDDNLLVNDWFGYGVILAFDQVVSGPAISLLDYSNHPLTPGGVMSNLSGPTVTGCGTNTQIWMADVTAGDSFGILRWSVGPGGVIASNDVGTTVVAAGSGSDLSVAPWDVAVDKNGKIYTIQNLQGGEHSNHVLCFPAYSGQTESNAIWKVVGTNDMFALANGVAVNPEASCLAVAVSGTDSQTGGRVVLLDTGNGDVITNLGNGSFSDVAWDNVGNLYSTEYLGWHVFSPPGTNQSTTRAVSRVQVLNTIERPQISKPLQTEGQLNFVLTGQGNVPYIIISSTNLLDWTPILTNYSASATRNIQIEAVGDLNYYRAVFYP